MSYKERDLFPSSPLSPFQPLASTTLAPLDSSDDDDESDSQSPNAMGHISEEVDGDDDDAGTTTAGHTTEMEEEFEVEAIVARKGGYNGKTLMYKIRWKGYGPDQDSWEPRSHISADDLVAAFEAKQLKADPKKRARPKPTSKPKTSSSRATPVPSASSNYSQESSQKRRHRVDRSEKKEKPFFWQPLRYEADELIVPVSSLISDAAWSRIRRRIEASQDSSEGRRQAVVIHPATLVRLRTQTNYARLNTYFRAGLKETVQMIQENEMNMLSNGSFPEESPFRDSALYDVLIGGEAFRLTWQKGIEDPDQEFSHIIATLQGLPERLGGKYRCRMLVRNIQPNIKEACDYFGVEVVDAKSIMKGL